MDLRIILPVKPFGEAKQRLAAVMTPSERARLAERMFRHVLTTVCAVAGPPAIVVVSRSTDVLDFAQAQGATVLTEHAPSDLNTALLQAAEFVRDNGASNLLVVAGDLPLICEADLAALALHDCAIAPDRHGRGTNALLWPVSSLRGFYFGENSFTQHREAARAAGLDPQTVIRQGLACDVDLPSDLADVRDSGVSDSR